MKVCPYCGTEYPGDAVMCAIDQTSLVSLKFKPVTASPKVSKNLPYHSGQRIFFALAFALLSGLCGMGLAWLVVGTVANQMASEKGIALVASSFSTLLVGGILGSFAGLIGFLVVVRPDKKSQEEAERKYVGPGGRMQIFIGAPFSLFIVLSIATFEWLEQRFGARVAVYTLFGVFLAMVLANMVLFDRIPSKYVIPIGIAGWTLLLALALWFGFQA